MAKLRKQVNKAGVSWQIDYYDPQGKRVMKCFPKKAEAEAYLGKVVAAKKEGRYHDVFNVKKETQDTFNDLAARYTENFGTQKAFRASKRYLLAVVQEHFGERCLSEITYLDLETYRNRRKATPAKGSKPRTDASVNREMALISHMIGKAVEWGMLETSPFKKGKRLMFKENNHRLRFLADSEIEALFKACDDLKT
jgi:predicted DNA-binding WGR domain protein